MLTVTCMLWSDPQTRWGDSYRYGPEYPNTLRRMVARNLRQPHEFVCITDDPTGLDDGIRVVPLTGEWVPGWRYQKLLIYREDAGQWLGERILYLDLDVVITGELDPMVDRPEDFVSWYNPCWPGRKNQRTRFNTSAVLLRAGSRPQVWRAWKGPQTHQRVLASKLSGSDQAIVSMEIDGSEAGWTTADGMYSFSKYVRTRGLPSNARLVSFHGRHSPNQSHVQRRHPWINRFYQ